ncbi:HD domain-containing protein [Lapillicoccus jejuensis]|uniref:Putative metal-dependent HD superfamily phosphohydrolase n=1 Tax=Lapillicoccus jejuensis TaxID=402171 RepID=A0A542E0R5_9MICO|nr:metal-dependent phosphohydrolase [Lapillicoccus jejuensis]TQJ08941.1 putative metal-dependent HD superfamily phosphohydrolase [Lapillicoccus jejuensis]
MPALITWWTQDLAVLAPDADPVAVQAVGADLLSRWREPHRRYHSTRHLVECFWALEELEEAGELAAVDAPVARLAAWLHDAVYDVAAPAGANEAASAALAREVLPRVGVDGAVVERVAGLVTMTADHVAGADADPLTAAFHDADLWVLSAPAERYLEYAAQVRQEYAVVPDDAFATGRAAVLGALLAQEPLYATSYGRSAWEARARAQVTAEVARLRG